MQSIKLGKIGISSSDRFTNGYKSFYYIFKVKKYVCMINVPQKTATLI